MALPASGAISISQVNTELGAASTTTRGLGDSAVRSLFGVASGAISMSNGYGKSSAFNVTITSNQANLNLRTWALANGWNGSTVATITVGAGVYIYSTSTANAGLTIDGTWPGGLTLINNGYIMGKGGDGPNATVRCGGLAGAAGGPAISLGVSCTITNNSYIGGGGGSGSSYGYPSVASGTAGGGGGAGGGKGGDGYNSTSALFAGGAGGGAGSNGADGSGTSTTASSSAGGGGGGGRVFPGTGGTAQTRTGAGVNTSPAGAGGGGAGGAGAYGLWRIGTAPGSQPVLTAEAAGGGGGWGASGGASKVYNDTLSFQTFPQNSGAGGAAGNAGGVGTISAATTGASGGAGGKAIALNGFIATRNGSGTTYGVVS